MVIVFDLDDTLYDEIDFVKSGFKEVSLYLKHKDYYDFMLNVFKKEGSGKVFNRLIDKYDLNVSIQKLIEIYRFHTPSISLDDITKEVLTFTKKYDTALISDGHYVMQKNKFNALGLKDYIDLPVFTDFYQTCKPEEKAFKIIMEYFPNNSFVYISDNPKKDFIAPNKLGWKSIRYKNPNGIYKDIQNNAMFEVSSKSEIIDCLKRL